MDARDLSLFEDKTFDLIWTRNVLEHISGVKRCLEECRRVLQPQGIMVHNMPNRTRRLFSFLLSLPRKRAFHVHGSYNSIISQFYYSGCFQWQKVFIDAGLKVEKIIALPFNIDRGFRYSSLVKLGNKVRLSSSYAYMLRK